MSFNKVIIVGNLGRDPEMKYTAQGTPICNFTLATNEKRKDRQGEMQDQTTWFRVTLWGRQAETAAQYLTKGKQVYIEGKLRIEEWIDKEGKSRHTLEVQATEMHFINISRDANDRVGGEARSDPKQFKERSTTATIDDDDIPF